MTLIEFCNIITNLQETEDDLLCFHLENIPLRVSYCSADKNDIKKEYCFVMSSIFHRYRKLSDYFIVRDYNEKNEINDIFENFNITFWIPDTTYKGIGDNPIYNEKYKSSEFTITKENIEKEGYRIIVNLKEKIE
jgi:hypothetical protein